MKKLNIIGMPMKFGCFVEGADQAFDKIRDLFDDIFEEYNINKIDINFDVNIEKELEKDIKFVNEVMIVSKDLHHEVSRSLNNNEFPIIIGGDHSTAIGSVSAAVDYAKADISIIWVDAHLDIHTDKTTPSGNIHGMPLSICIGNCSKEFDIGNYKLNPKNIFYIGARSYEEEEINYVKNQGINIYYDYDVENMGIENVINDVLSKITTKYVHISFDLDIIKDDEFPAVNVGIQKRYIEGYGVSLTDTKKCLELLIKNTNLISMDFVEYNPLLDTDNSCKLIIKDLLNLINNTLKNTGLLN